MFRVTLFAATRSISLIVSNLVYLVSSFRARTSLARAVLPIMLFVSALAALVEAVVASRITLPVPVILAISTEVPLTPPCPVALSIISFRVLLTSSALAFSLSPEAAPEAARADRFRLGASWLAVTIFSIPDIEVNLPAKLPVPSVRVSLPAPPIIANPIALPSAPMYTSAMLLALEMIRLSSPFPRLIVFRLLTLLFHAIVVEPSLSISVRSAAGS